MTTIAFHQHRFDNVEGYLHHRAPYLMVDRVVEIDEQSVVTERTFTDQDFFVAGHFPGASIVPGAMLQELTTQSAGVLIAANFNPMSDFKTDDPKFNEFALGVLVKIKQARFVGFVRPGDTLAATVKMVGQAGHLFDFHAEVRRNNDLVMRNRFQLANVQSRLLF